MRLAEHLALRHARIGQRETLPAPTPGRGPHALFRHGRVGPFGLDEVLVVERLGQLEGDPAPDDGLQRGMLAAQVAPEGVFLEHLFEESEKVGVGFAPGARQARGGRGSAGEGERSLPRPGGDLGLLLLAQGGDEVRLEIEQPRHHLRGRELRVGRPRQLRMEARFERRRAGPQGREIHRGQVLGQLRLHGAAQQKIATEAEEDRFRARRGGLPPPLLLDAEETGDEGGERPRRLDEQAGSRERVEAARIGAVGTQPVGQRGVLPGEPREKSPVEVGQAAVAVEILVREAGLAERKVPPGRGRGWRGRFQALGL